MQINKIILLSLFAVTAFFFALFDFSQANEFSYNLKGRILLQVEDHGRIWYVNPQNLKAYEIRKENYREVLSNLAVGISNEDIQKVEMEFTLIDPNVDTDGDGYPDKTEVYYGYDPYGPGRWQGEYTFARTLAGKFLLQVEDRGRLWYVHPENLKRYELTENNFDEFFPMIVLGINNADFSNIIQANEVVEWTRGVCETAECFMAKFSVCSSVEYRMVLNDDYILQYVIWGKQEGEDRCRMTSKFLINPDKNWQNKTMDCYYDYTNKNIGEALMSVFDDPAARCFGPLYDLFEGKSYGGEQ